LALQTLPASRVLRSTSGSKNLFSDLLRLSSAVNSDDFEVDRLIPLLTAVLNNECDEVTWDHVYIAVTEHSPPPPRSLPFLGQTPYLHNTSSFVNSSEHRKYVDAVLKEELGSLFVGVPDFYKAFFGDIENLEEAGIAVFRRCKGDSPIYSDEAGWRDWPEHATQNEVLQWLTSQVNLFRDLAEEQGFTTNTDRRIWARPSRFSTGNLMMNEDKDNPSQRAFLIDLDLAIRLQRDEPSGARGKTGTRAFMPIDLLLGEKQSFMHGLETFFWYIFWVCIHHNGPEESRVVPMFDKWNYVDMEELAKLKLDTVAQETIFLRTVTENFTPYYKPLIPWVNRLRKVVFGQTMGERRSIALFPVQSNSQEGKRRSTSDRGTLSFRLPLFPPPKTRGYSTT